MYQEGSEIASSKKKKKDSLNNGSTKSINNLLGSIYIPLNSIESNQPIEKWYRLENISDLVVATNGNSNNSSSSNNNGGNNTQSMLQSSSYDTINSSSSNTTTHDLNIGKDSVLIRVKAKYNCVDILPLCCYDKLIKVN